MKRQLITAAMLCIVALASQNARAGACTCNAQTLTVTPGFSVFSTSPQQPTATFSLDCNGNATYDMTISTGSSGTYANRTMLNGLGDVLNYNIYTDAARTIVWDETTGKREYITTSGQNTLTDSLFLTIPGTTQDVAYSGPLYQDTVTVTLKPVSGGSTKNCTFTIQTSVIGECLAPGATLNFGTYDPVTANATAASPLDATTSLMYTCTKNVPATIQLDQGLYPSGGRRLSGPASNFLSYELYTSSARTVIWGTTIGTNTVTMTSTSKNVPLGGAGGLPVYGRIPGGQDVVAGSYSDSVTATVNY